MPRSLPPTSPFAADDGSADPRLSGVLEAYGSGAADVADVVAALAPARVLVPVLAHEVHDGETGADGEREAETQVVAVRAPDGRTALPVFTSVAALAAWRADARPMPALAPRAAASALAEGWPLLVVDPGGPVSVLVPRPAVQALAAGLPWLPAVRGGDVRPDVAAAVAAGLERLPQVGAVRVEPGRTSEVAVVLTVAPGLDRGQLTALLADVNRVLAADPMVAQIDTLELRPVAG